jgi:hypothetical protein
MKAADVYGLLGTRLSPWCRAQGFKKLRGSVLGYHRPVSDGFVVFWVQCDKYGWDAFSGSRFVLEFQRGKEPGIGLSANEPKRLRLGRILSDKEREDVRTLQNQVIARLPAAPSNHPAFGANIPVWFLDQFKPIAKPYGATDDLWLRYYSEADVTAWAEFLEPLLPSVLARFEQLSAPPSGVGRSSL